MVIIQCTLDLDGDFDTGSASFQDMFLYPTHLPPPHSLVLWSFPESSHLCVQNMTLACCPALSLVLPSLTHPPSNVIPQAGFKLTMFFLHPSILYCTMPGTTVLT